MNFPCLIYKAPGPIVRARYSYANKAITNQAELERSLAQGWFQTLTEALESAGARAERGNRRRQKPPRKPSQPFSRVQTQAAAKNTIAQTDAHVKIAPVEQSDDAAPSREELIQKANELGLTFGKRTSNKMLATMITQALSKQGA